MSRYGVFALAASLDHIGPMTRSAADAGAMLGAIAGFDANDPTSLTAPFFAEADALPSALVLRADALEGCIEGSEEKAELAVITDAIEGYEAVRWPLGKEPGGKG